MPLERLTMLVVPRDADATLVVPRLEAPRVVERPDVFAIRPWDETEDPVAIVAELCGAAGDGCHRRPYVGPVPARPAARAAEHCVREGERGHRSLAGGEGRGRGRGVAPSRGGRRSGGGRAASAARYRSWAAPRPTCRPTSVVACWPRAITASTSPSSRPDRTRPARTTMPADRVIEPGEVVLCDFGGTMLTEGGAGYCSDITRCVHVGEPPAEFAELYAVLAGRTGGRRGGGNRRHLVRGRRRRGPAGDRRCRARPALHAPDRPRHRHRGARGPVHRRRQLDSARRRATRSRSSPASTCRAAGARASKTSWSPPTQGPDALNRVSHALAIVDG